MKCFKSKNNDFDEDYMNHWLDILINSYTPLIEYDNDEIDEIKDNFQIFFN
ncbi:hypothetical protein [Methanobrevibacter sp. DSM 116169]|uniref:hypothetical protein n=1 Tax=Methanobrevibacter sp. DSM 116169 TaxID=3242727 RepID=UPI0038FBFA97